MNLAQFHCTPAPPGADGPGLRFTAISPGVPRTVLDEAEQLIGYEPPRSAPPRPSASELAAFPAVFSHSSLADGGRLLARTVCTGADPSGRSDFHAHCVHLPLDTELPGGVLPIATWRSPQWAAVTPDGGVPRPLETLSAPWQFDRDELADFAAVRAPWLAVFFDALRRTDEEEAAARIVLVERDSSNVARWIALACAVLPDASAHRLTFTTYTRQPRQAGQQIIGVLPDDVQALAGHEERYRVIDCTVPGPGEPAGQRPPDSVATESGRPDRWAELAAEIWLSRAPELFAAAPSLPGGHFDAGRLAVAALRSGTALGPSGRTAAADWVVDHPDALTESLRQRLATELAPELRAGIADSAQDVPRAVELLRIADVLGVDCTDLLAEVAGRQARALIADPDGAYTPGVRTVLEDRFEFRAALLGELDALAAADPPAAVRLLARIPLLFTGVLALPHLRMCAAAPSSEAVGSDRVAALHTVVRAGGVSLFADPPVLRTAVRLVWGSAAMTAGEARLLLGQNGSDPFRASGAWADIVRAALEAPGEDPAAPDLAHDVLRSFPEDLEPRARAALLLLEFAGDLRDGTVGSGWAGRAVSLRSAAEPVEPTVLDHAFGAVARRLLSPDRPDGELYALIDSGDPDLVAAYGRAARQEAVRDRLRAVPAYVADCFSAWSARPKASPAWDETRTSLLDKVLRPVVRALPDADITSVEGHLEREGGRWTREFREWNRPGALSRIGRRLSGRGRRPSPDDPGRSS
ncbi:GTPase-associated protein 1-related protein [Streptomyces sp. NBC_01387]|uniref:GTPase-associated protein 1-related protein n=1 Tax=unclassified Streptomyces TaxID=2593676 RepID=UPI00224CD89D|nr:GTPase-associated protein 1-related protein [Streptomyces sp. NBC_01500]MCX4547429.1 GTPase-associated protein 1-related protein [Streptomyces sp. NBC_01500]